MTTARNRGWIHLIGGIFCFGTTIWLGDRIVIANSMLANRQTTITLLALAACFMFCVAALHAAIAFLFLRRLVTEVHRDDDQLTLVSASGRKRVLSGDIRIIKRVGNPYEYTVPPVNHFIIFAADRRWWIAPAAAFHEIESNVLRPATFDRKT